MVVSGDRHPSDLLGDNFNYRGIPSGKSSFQFAIQAPPGPKLSHCINHIAVDFANKLASTEMLV